MGGKQDERTHKRRVLRWKEEETMPRHIRQTRKASIGLASGVCLGECQWPDGDGSPIPGAAE